MINSLKFVIVISVRKRKRVDHELFYFADGWGNGCHDLVHATLPKETARKAYGESTPAQTVIDNYGFTVENVVNVVKGLD